ncbi:MAG: inositol monophosphatase [Propionibacteriaceae bacterium]
MSSPADVDLGLALDVARECADVAIRITRETPLGDIDTKAHAADVVTQVDTAVERAVRAIIGERLPDHVVVGEEYGGEAGAGPTWYCDPVDGTTNLAAGLPWTSFSLSLAVGADPLVGVVADPWRSEVLHAVAGGGAFLNDAPATSPPHRNALSGGVVLTEWAAHRPWPGMLEFLSLLSERFCTTRVMGSSTLTLAHLGAGRCSGAVVGEFHPEDHLAASLICAEAGLTVWDESGTTRLFPSTGGIMVARPAVAAELFELWSRARHTGPDA